MASTSVLISEVGPRDGLQSVAAILPTAHKCAWIDALVAAGLREIEVGSFVPAARLPQLADTADVVRHALGHPGLRVMAPNDAVTAIREATDGAPVEHVYLWASIAGMPDELVDRHVELLCTEVAPALRSI